MKTVIDIDEMYIGLAQQKMLMGGDLSVLSKAIATGTPLPKNHGRLIDADTLCNDLVDCWDIADKEKKELINVVMANIVTPIIVNQPTIIEADKGEAE